MGETTIEWTRYTFNPWIGCTKVSPGCMHCYAETLDRRWGRDSWGPGKPRRRTSHTYWNQPLKWDAKAKAAGRRDRVFCASLADVFDAEAPPYALEDLWTLIRLTPNLDWLLLTKRPERIQANLPWGPFDDPWPNVWLGTSVEDQRRCDERVPFLTRVPAKVRFLSCEPLLGSITLPLGGLQWVIVGGESGHGARPMDLELARSLRDQCKENGVAFFFKQVGAQLAQASLKGGTEFDIPHDLLIRDYPVTT